MKMLYCAAATLVMLGGAGTASATTVVDAAGDFAPGYTGAAADLDVTSFSIRYSAVTDMFTLGATMAGAIDPATAGLYVIGVNTGSGTIAPFAALGAPNVRFNQVVRVNKDGTAFVGNTPVAATISGNMFSVNVSGSLFPGTGFAVRDYTWNLWPRNGTGPGSFVTDFAPDDAMVAGSVPEPASWALMIAGIGVVGGSLRSRRRTTVRFA